MRKALKATKAKRSKTEASTSEHTHTHTTNEAITKATTKHGRNNNEGNNNGIVVPNRRFPAWNRRHENDNALLQDALGHFHEEGGDDDEEGEDYYYYGGEEEEEPVHQSMGAGPAAQSIACAGILGPYGFVQDTIFLCLTPTRTITSKTSIQRSRDIIQSGPISEKQTFSKNLINRRAGDWQR